MHFMRPLHCRGESYCTQRLGGDARRLRTAHAYSCEASVAPLRTRRRNAGRGVFAAKKFNKSDTVEM